MVLLFLHCDKGAEIYITNEAVIEYVQQILPRPSYLNSLLDRDRKLLSPFFLSIPIVPFGLKYCFEIK